MKQIISVLIFSLFLIGCGSGGTTSTQASDNAPVNVNKDELLSLINEARAISRMCGDTSYSATGDLQWNGILAIVAQNHSNDMNTNDFLSHTSSDGSTLQDRLSQVGYASTSYAGENIAKGYTTEQSVVEGWLESSGHCANIMNPNYKFMGVATAGTYWTQVFSN
jgi:uncharacterized protein YkwD